MRCIQFLTPTPGMSLADASNEAGEGGPGLLLFLLSCTSSFCLLFESGLKSSTDPSIQMGMEFKSSCSSLVVSVWLAVSRLLSYTQGNLL